MCSFSQIVNLVPSHAHMLRCVEFLVGHGADLFIENSNGQTACDLAVACGHHQVKPVAKVSQ